MKTSLIKVLVTSILLLIPILNFAQAPHLGTSAHFVLFPAVGSVGNTGILQLTGHVGFNSGFGTGFGNVKGATTNNNGATAHNTDDVVILAGCSSDVSDSFPVLPVSVKDTEVSQSFEIYPNPNRGQFTIKVKAAKPVVLNIEIYNNLGDLLWKLDKVSIDGTYTTPVALSYVPAGIYMVALRNKYTNIVRKIVVTK